MLVVMVEAFMVGGWLAANMALLVHGKNTSLYYLLI
jgi:hypothetical protein